MGRHAVRSEEETPVATRSGRVLSAAEFAADAIRDMLYHGAVRPGERLNPDELAARLQMSKTPVRDALQGLKLEGLVEVVPRVGVFVKKMTAQESTDVYRLKMAVEPLAASLAAERGDERARSELRRKLRRLASATSRANVAKAEEAVNDIHQQLFDMCGSEVVRETFRVINGRVRLLRFQNMAQKGRLTNTLEQHEAVVDAVARGDAAAAERLMREHLDDAARALQEVIAANDEAAGEAS
jgi:GntR family transcriptional regulator, rspAB operon transcriptional repressor